MDKEKLASKLLEAFAQYLFAQEYPMGNPNYHNLSVPPWQHKYMTDIVFNHRVDSLTYGVIQIITEVEELGK